MGEIKMEQEYNVAIVLAAGKGSRMHTRVQKQYIQIGGHPLLYYSLKQFELSDEISEIVLVTGAGEIDYCQKEIAEKYGLKKVKKIVAGGAERYLSVYEGLKVCHGDYVLIHDGARPFVDGNMIARTLAAARKDGACVAAMPVKDTIKVSDQDGYADRTPERSSLWMVQTPQTFGYRLIREAYDRLIEEGITGVTDDAMVLERMNGRKVKLAEGSYQNIKVTTPEDILIAEAFLNAGKYSN